MKKTLLTKMRRWDENIGKLIVFAITIIIAVGVLGTLAYFYNQSREVAAKMSILTATNSSSTDLKDSGFCDSTTGRVLYDPLTWIYGLDCAGITTGNKDAITKVKGIVAATCSDNITGAGADYCYKVQN